jgi:polyphosphate kinase
MVDDAKEVLKRAHQDIPQKLLTKYEMDELDQFKHEFKKFILHSIIEWKRTIFGVDGYDGSRKTSITTELTNPSTIYHNSVIQRASLWVPTTEELSLSIFDLYKKHFPWKGKMLFLDRSWNNRAFVQYHYGYCSKDQYEAYIASLWEELDRLLDENADIVMSFFFEITKSFQKKRLWERKEDPQRNHRFSKSDARAIEMHEVIRKESRKIEKIYKSSRVPFIRVQTADKEKAMIALLKCILQHQDYPKKSKKLDFTPDISIIKPTKDEVAKVMTSKL